MGRKKKHEPSDTHSKPFSMNIPEDIHTKFKMKAVECGRSMRDLLIDIISEYVNRDTQRTDPFISEDIVQYEENINNHTKINND